MTGWVGLAALLAGVAVSGWCAWRCLRMLRHQRRAGSSRGHPPENAKQQLAALRHEVAGIKAARRSRPS